MHVYSFFVLGYFSTATERCEKLLNLLKRDFSDSMHMLGSISWLTPEIVEIFNCTPVPKDRFLSRFIFILSFHLSIVCMGEQVEREWERGTQRR